MSGPSSSSSSSARADRWIGIATAAALLIVYAPMLLWVGRASVHLAQLQAGALLVVIAVVLSLREAAQVPAERRRPGWEGIAGIAAGAALLLAAHAWPALGWPLATLSLGASLAGAVSLLYGRAGVRACLPALAGLALLSLLAAAFPRLDWPLRATAARYAQLWLQGAGFGARVVLSFAPMPELTLDTGGRLFRVATECNGFGLLSSSLLLAAMLGFRYRLSADRIVALLALAGPLAIALNTLRIVSICVTAVGTRLPYGLIHEGFGQFYLLVGLVVLWQLARWAAALSGPRPASPGAKP